MSLRNKEEKNKNTKTNKISSLVLVYKGVVLELFRFLIVIKILII
jgi:hypothetical protein